MLKSLIDFFGCGRYYLRSNQDGGDFIIENFSDITEKLIPFLDNYPVLGVKSLDYAKFKEVADMIHRKEHLTELGLKKIQDIKSDMNL